MKAANNHPMRTLATRSETSKAKALYPSGFITPTRRKNSEHSIPQPNQQGCTALKKNTLQAVRPNTGGRFMLTDDNSITFGKRNQPWGSTGQSTKI